MIAAFDKSSAQKTDCVSIGDLNDVFRRTFFGGRVVVTPGIRELPESDRIKLLEAVQGYDGFDDGNDPFREHDFGAIDLGEQRYLWKIDAYDRRLKFASPDPGDPRVTTRVLTIMCADEY